jgi:hypothetical protein
MNDLATPSSAWETYFETHFSGSNALTTKLIRNLVARICAQNAALKSKLEKRSKGMPYIRFLGVVKREKLIKDLKRVAKGVPEVQELIVEFVQNQGAILRDGVMMAPAPAVREAAVIEPDEDEDEDGRESMVLRVRTFEQILMEIGTTQSRRVDRYRQLRDEMQQREGEPDKGGGQDSDSELELEVLVIDNGKRTWVGSNSLASAAEELGGALREREDGAPELREGMQCDTTGVPTEKCFQGCKHRQAQ